MKTDLNRLAAFIQSHGFSAFADPDCVRWALPWVHRATGEQGIDWLECRTFGEAREQLGY